MPKGRYKHEIPLDLRAPLPECAKSKPVQSLQRPQYHGDECYCSSCADLRAAVSLHLEDKRLRDVNGFN